MDGYTAIFAMLAALRSADRQRKTKLLAATPAAKERLLRRAGFVLWAEKWQRKAEAIEKT